MDVLLLKTMRNLRLLFSTLVILLLLPFFVHAQLSVNNSLTTAQIQNLLFGPDVTVNNFTITCPNGAYGTFNGASSNIGLTNGVILTTGSINVAPGPNNSPSAGINNGWGGDLDLENLFGGSSSGGCIIGGPCNQVGCTGTSTINGICSCTNCGATPNKTYDACRIDFDIIPTCDSIRINYVFASEEYLEFVNKGVNDAFGFFISGPGITGKQDIALVPGSNIPVSIDNVNSWKNGAYYINNPNGISVQYDGFTRVLQAKAKVVPCSTYHLKLVIADLGDGIYDSGVFLQTGGINCGAPKLTLGGSNAVEGCTNGAFTVALSQAQTKPTTILYTMSGTATNGTDYNTLSGSLVIPAGQTNATIPVTAFADGIIEGNESVVLKVGQTTCSSVITSTYTITVADPPLLNLTASATTSCYGKTVNVSASGMNTYSWSPSTGLNTTLGNNVIATVTNTISYTVTGTSSSGCTNTNTVTLSMNTLPTITVSSSSPVKCKGQSNGAATVTVVGGTPAYTYIWSPSGGSSSNASNLTANTYSVVVTDSKGCSQKSTIVISQPVNNLSATFSNVVPVSCHAEAAGSATVNAAGGTSPYTYLWTGLGNTTSIASSLVAGTYTVIVTDNNLCSVAATVTITQPSAMVLAVSAANTNCGSNTGTAAVAVVGGTAPYAYLWSGVGSSTAAIANLGPNLYQVIVTDSKGCTKSASATVNTFTSPTVGIISTSIANIKCYGSSSGSAVVSVSGGTSPYSYIWGSGPGESTLTAATSFSITGLRAGNYNIVVKDAAGCQGSISPSLTLTEPPKLFATISGNNITSVSCYGQATGAATVSAYGGTLPFSYLWSNSLGTNSSVSNLTAGNYSVTVSDKMGCTAIQSVSITQPSAALTTSAKTVTPILCHGNSNGYIEVSVAGGTTPYSYNWNPNVGNGSDASNLPSGTYSIVVTDNKGCTAYLSVQLTQPALPLTSAITNKTDVTCNALKNGSATVSVNGGTNPYTYVWSGISSTTSSISNLSKGSYSVVVTDANGCTLAQSISISEPPVLVADIDLSQSNPVTCYGGKDACLTVTAAGGSPAYSYKWTNGATGSSLCNLSAGTYTVEVTDKNNCMVQVNGKATIINQPPLMDVSIQNSNNGSICYGSNVTLTALANNVSDYKWEPNDQTTQVITVSPTVNTTYSVTVKDNQGCTGTQSILISVKPQPSLDVSSIQINADNCGKGDGSIGNVIIGGGTPNYNYEWKNNNGTVVSTQKDLINQVSGKYTLTITDAHGCKASTGNSLSIPYIVGVVASFSATPITGEIPLVVNVTEQSTGATLYNWNFGNGTTSNLKQPLPVTYIQKGIYKIVLIASNAKGCSDTAEAEIVVTAPSICEEANVFTPNGDGNNDVFRLHCINLETINAEIFNRWGQKIYEWKGVMGGWDGISLAGEAAPDGTYFYFIQAIGLDGKTYETKGFLQLVR